MSGNTFFHLLLWNNPLATLCFFAFAMSFISLWIRRTAWLWGAFLVIAFILALESNTATWMTLIPLLILLFCHYFLKREIGRSTRFFLFGIALVISGALAFHFLPGFHNWRLTPAMPLSPGAQGYSLWFNFDKPFIGIFALALSIPLITTRKALWTMFKLAIPMSVGGILILMALSLYFGMVKWDPKIPVISLLWLFDNLLFVSIPEEAFFRGFLQQGIYNWFGKNTLSAFLSICVTSLVFALLHLAWVANLPFLALVFIASVIYGTIYQLTKSIEASILCHFSLNVVHFFLFTYPALK